MSRVMPRGMIYVIGADGAPRPLDLSGMTPVAPAPCAVLPEGVQFGIGATGAPVPIGEQFYTSQFEDLAEYDENGDVKLKSGILGHEDGLLKYDSRGDVMPVTRRIVRPDSVMARDANNDLVMKAAV